MATDASNGSTLSYARDCITPPSIVVSNQARELVAVHIARQSFPGIAEHLSDREAPRFEVLRDLLPRGRMGVSDLECKIPDRAPGLAVRAHEVVAVKLKRARRRARSDRVRAPALAENRWFKDFLIPVQHRFEQLLLAGKK
jgi:hypothetical protein